MVSRPSSSLFKTAIGQAVGNTDLGRTLRTLDNVAKGRTSLESLATSALFNGQPVSTAIQRKFGAEAGKLADKILSQVIGTSEEHKTGVYLEYLREAREVNWGKSFNWDVKLDGAPAPFNKWFPATDVNHTLGFLSSFDVPVGASTFKVPGGSMQKDFTLTFTDDDRGTLESWMENWYNEIFDPYDGTVLTVSEAALQFEFATLDSRREAVLYRTLWAYPEGQFQTVKDSQSNMVVLVQNFTIVSMKKK